MPRKKRREIKALTPEQERAVLSAAGVRFHRDYLIVKLGLLTGMRVDEIAHTRIENIQKRNKVWHIGVQPVDGWTPKYDGSRWIPVEPDLPAELFKYAEGRTSGYLFLSERSDGEGSYSRLKKRRIEVIYHGAARRAGITEPKLLRAHAMRHTFATKLNHRGESLPHIKYVLGHSEMQTTFIYLQLLPMSPADAAKLARSASIEEEG